MNNGSPTYECGDSSIRWLHVRLNEAKEAKEAIVSVPVDLPEMNEQSFITDTLSKVFLIPSSLLDIRPSDGGVFEAKVKLPIGLMTIDSWIEGTVQDVNRSLSRHGDGTSTQCFGYSLAEAVAYSNEDSIRVCDVVLNHASFTPLSVEAINLVNDRHNPSQFTMFSRTQHLSSMQFTVPLFTPSFQLSLFPRIFSLTYREMLHMITMRLWSILFLKVLSLFMHIR